MFSFLRPERPKAEPKPPLVDDSNFRRALENRGTPSRIKPASREALLANLNADRKIREQGEGRFAAGYDPRETPREVKRREETLEAVAKQEADRARLMEAKDKLAAEMRQREEQRKRLGPEAAGFGDIMTTRIAREQDRARAVTRSRTSRDMGDGMVARVDSEIERIRVNTKNLANDARSQEELKEWAEGRRPNPNEVADRAQRTVEYGEKISQYDEESEEERAIQSALARDYEPGHNPEPRSELTGSTGLSERNPKTAMSDAETTADRSPRGILAARNEFLSPVAKETSGEEGSRSVNEPETVDLFGGDEPVVLAAARTYGKGSERPRTRIGRPKAEAKPRAVEEPETVDFFESEAPLAVAKTEKQRTRIGRPKTERKPTSEPLRHSEDIDPEDDIVTDEDPLGKEGREAKFRAERIQRKLDELEAEWKEAGVSPVDIATMRAEMEAVMNKARGPKAG